MGETPEPALTDPTTGSGASSEREFVLQAERTGLVLPRRRALDPWLAATLTVALVGASLWAGLATHGFNPTVAPSRPGACTSPAITLEGSVAPGVDPTLSDAYRGFASGYFNWTDRCFAVALNSSPEGAALAPLASGISDFVLVGAPPPVSELDQLPSPAVVLPVTVGALDILYHPPSSVPELNLTPSILAGICLGTIQSWSDPALEAVNPGLSGSPARPILTAYLAGASGAAADLSTYLSETNATWRAEVGVQQTVSWPHERLLNSTTAMAEYLVTTPGSLGFLPDAALSTVATWGLGVAHLENVAGRFASANATGLETAATSAAGSVGGAEPLLDPELSAANATGTWSYPLTTFSYAVLYEDVETGYGGKVSAGAGWELLQFFVWATQLAQSGLGAVGLQPAPGALASVAESVLYQVTYDGASLLLGGSEGEAGESGGETGEF